MYLVYPLSNNDPSDPDQPKEGIYIQVPDDLNDTEMSDWDELIHHEFKTRFDRDPQFFDKSTREAFPEFVTDRNDIPASFSEISTDHFFRYGNWVKVRSGVYDRYLKMHIGNFIGQVVDFYTDYSDDIFYIQWASEFLQRIPTRKVSRLIGVDISPFGTYVSSNLILPIFHEEDQAESNDAKLAVFLQHLPSKHHPIFDQLFQSDPIKSNRPLESIWEAFWHELITRMQPIEVHLPGQRIGLLMDTAGSDDKCGVWVLAAESGNELILPMLDLLDIEQRENLPEILEFYRLWANLFLH